MNFRAHTTIHWERYLCRLDKWAPTCRSGLKLGLQRQGSSVDLSNWHAPLVRSASQGSAPSSAEARRPEAVRALPDTGMRSADPARAAEGLRTLSGPQSRGATGTVLDDYDNIKVKGCS
jgi:hypothetical protein